jgi:hypothetical protein
MRNFISVLMTALTAITLTAGCGNPQKKLAEAAAAENSGDHRAASQLFAAVALEVTPAFNMPEPTKGKVIKPEAWQGEIEKYIGWLTDPAPQRDNTFRDAIDGLARTAAKVETWDNTINTPPGKPIDTLPAFTANWNLAFNPPIGETINWSAIVKNAADKKHSVLCVSAPQNYTYEVNIVSRKTARRVQFTLYSESKMYIPLPPAEYSIIVRSSVEFQKGQQKWTSEYTLFSLEVTDEMSLINMDFRTRVARKN